MDTTGYGGSRINKNAAVFTDDPANPRLILVLSGPVTEFATVDPKRVILRGMAGEPLEKQVKIVPKEKYPFKIKAVRAANGANIRYKLEDKQLPEGGYLLTIENVLAHKGRYTDTIIIKTDSQIRPEIRVGVFGDVAEAPPARTPK